MKMEGKKKIMPKPKTAIALKSEVTFSVCNFNETAAAAALHPAYPADHKISKIFEKQNRKFCNNSSTIN